MKLTNLPAGQVDTRVVEAVLLQDGLHRFFVLVHCFIKVEDPQLLVNLEVREACYFVCNVSHRVDVGEEGPVQQQLLHQLFFVLSETRTLDWLGEVNPRRQSQVLELAVKKVWLIFLRDFVCLSCELRR